jgi:alcohol dehydrogenase (cytochrome c)
MTCPDLSGGTNFYPPSYDPTLRLFFVNARETCATYFGWRPDFKRGEWFLGGATQKADGPQGTFGALRAIDPATGERKWELRYPGPGTAGVLTTASGLAFTGDDTGNVLAVDSRTGKLAWHYQMGATVHGTSCSYRQGRRSWHLHCRKPRNPDGMAGTTQSWAAVVQSWARS